jgi:hypothetical protein
VPQGQLRKFFSRVANRKRRTGGSDQDSVTVPEHLDWWIWRVASHERIKSGLIEIQTQWSLTDILDAHDVIDLYEEAERKAAKKLARK